jgi:hypothetical protein
MRLLEEWKQIPLYDNYEASNTGKVRNKTTKQILKPNINSKGYRHVVLYKGSRKDKHMIGVHRAVAMAWIPTSDYSLTVNHIDEDKNNNSASNLEWMSNKDNVQYSQGHKVKCIETQKIYASISEASRDTGIAFATIKRSLSNRYQKTKRSKLSFISI